MLTLIIIDDEKKTREILKDCIPWTELGIGIVETAKNGLDALELVNRIKPDIILSDIRMPKMDGIELATNVRELYPDCKIIFISGYADKEYLKAAIHLNAVTYIEKPINIKELQSIVSKTVSLCIEESKKKSDIDILKNALDRSVPLILQEITLELIKDNANVSALFEGYGHQFPIFPLNGYITAASVILDWKSGIDSQIKDSLKRSILQVFCISEYGDSPHFIAGFTQNDTLVLIITEALDTNSIISKDTLNQVMLKLMKISQSSFNASIGVGTTVNNVNLLPESYRQSVIALSKHFYKKTSGIYYFPEILPSHFEVDTGTFTTFRQFLKKDDRKGVVNLVKILTDKARISEDSNINNVKNIYFSLLMIIYEVAKERRFVEYAVETDRKGYIWQEIDSFGTLSELSEYILTNIEVIFNRMEEKDVANKKIYEIVQYIKAHFPDKDLSIQSIADHTYLSQSYLCAFFKRNTGKTLNEYITEVRIEKAKELLNDSRVKLYEVALNIGFTDANWFSTIFKKYEGCTPSEFREKQS